MCIFKDRSFRCLRHLVGASLLIVISTKLFLRIKIQLIIVDKNNTKNIFDHLDDLPAK